MPRTITLTDVQVRVWSVNVAQRSVKVGYRLLDTEGNPFESGRAIFWETIPTLPDDEFGNPQPTPDHWYQLPPAYSQVLTDLTTDLRAGLLGLINE